MPIQKRLRLPTLLAVASLVFVASQLLHEHLNGGVRAHHLLDRSDLPAISNWLGLIVLPTLGWLFGTRLRNHRASPALPRRSSGLWMGLVGALIYGSALAAAFELDASAVSSVMFLGLFLLAILFPLYRAEYVLGFVVGMTITFGAVLPALVAAVIAAFSATVRFIFRAVASAVRSLGDQ